jgi:uncharacterized SAM-binding protein YcdF (DUF218 family)
MRYPISIIIFLHAVWGMSLYYTWARPGEQSILSKAEAIILLSGDYKERAPVAAQLYRAGYAPMILLTNDGVFSGWSAKNNRNLYQVEWTEEELVKLAVPRDKIVKLPFFGGGTIYDALAVRQYVLQHGEKKLIIVTSDYHVKRALWTFRKVFSGMPVEISAYPAVSHSIGIWGRAIERVKFLYYLIRYGVLGLIPGIDERGVRY